MGGLTGSAQEHRQSRSGRDTFIDAQYSPAGRAAVHRGADRRPRVTVAEGHIGGQCDWNARVETEIVGAEAMLTGPDNPIGDAVTFRTLNAYFTSIGGGTDQIQRNIVGERVLGLPKEPEPYRNTPFRELPH